MVMNPVIGRVDAVVDIVVVVAASTVGTNPTSHDISVIPFISSKHIVLPDT